MPRIHPKAEVLDGLLRFFPEERNRLLRHRSRPREAPKGKGRQVLSWRSSGAEYDRAVDDVLDRFRPRLEAAVREMAEAPGLLSEILGNPPEQWEALARGERFRSFALCRLLLDRSYEETIETPGEGERLAALALTITDSLDPARYGDRVLADARARVWVAIANARRVAADLWGSEQALQTAEEHLRLGIVPDRLAIPSHGLGRPPHREKVDIHAAPFGGALDAGAGDERPALHPVVGARSEVDHLGIRV